MLKCTFWCFFIFFLFQEWIHSSLNWVFAWENLEFKSSGSNDCLWPCNVEFQPFWSPTDTLVQLETYNLTGSNSRILESTLLCLNYRSLRLIGSDLTGMNPPQWLVNWFNSPSSTQIHPHLTGATFHPPHSTQVMVLC